MCPLTSSSRFRGVFNARTSVAVDFPLRGGHDWRASCTFPISTVTLPRCVDAAIFGRAGPYGLRHLLPAAPHPRRITERFGGRGPRLQLAAGAGMNCCRALNFPALRLDPGVDTGGSMACCRTLQ